MRDVPFLRTVLGDIPAAEAGVCYSHEHIVIEPSFTTFRYPEFLLNDLDKIAAELAGLRRAGCRTMIDSMPCGGGRSALKLAEVSHRAGMHIVCPTGLHLEKYYPPGHWSERMPAERLAAIFIDEIGQGIDANDGNGPSVERTPHRAGVIKVASGLDGINDRQRKIFEAAAISHRATGCPILTHSEQGTAALEQAQLLGSLGVPPGKIAISHTDRKPDPAYHREILSSGVFLEYDSAFRWPAEGNPTRDLILTLCADGYAGQLLVGMDAARSAYWKSYGGSPGLTFLIEKFFPELIAAGLDRRDADRILIDNPARVFSFEARQS